MNEALRPWFDSGLTHVFGTGEEQALPAWQQDATFVQNAAQPEQVAAASLTSAAVTAGRFARRSASVGSTSPSSAAEPRESSDSKAGGDPQWQQLAKRITHRSLAIWTYWELGSDLLATPSVSRRNFLGQLIQAMRLPRGNIAFWPLSVPVEDDLISDVHWFWRGVSRYGAEQVFCFGKHAAELLQGSESTKARSRYAPNIPEQTYPGVDELAAMPGLEFMTHLLALMQAHRAL